MTKSQCNTPDNPMTAERLAEIRAREQAATKGPWGPHEMPPLSETHEWMEIGPYPDAPVAEVNDNDGPNWRNNAEFIGHSREDIPDLLAEVERLRAELKRYEWRPVAEIHEDYGQCVLMDIYDPADLVIGSNLDNDFEIERWTHFTEVPKLTTEKARLLLLAEELAIPERAL